MYEIESFTYQRLQKSQIRTRKRTALSGDQVKFKEAKYDSYFTPGAMSDDEDEYTLGDGGVWSKSENRFVSREWNFISQEVRVLLLTFSGDYEVLLLADARLS